MDAAMEQGIDITPAILEQADAVIENGEAALSERVALELAQFGEIAPLDERAEADQAFLAALHCSEERIAAEQAALDAQAEG